MRRATPQKPISPKLLKHFAAATVVITVCLAMFASGNQTAIKAQIQAHEAKNQLLQTEAEKLGTHKIAASITNNASPVGWAEDDVGGESVVSGSGSIEPDAPRPALGASQAALRPLIPTNLPSTPGATVTVKGMIDTDLSGPQGDAARAKKKGKAGIMFKPNAQQIKAIKAKSLERTGGSSQKDF